MAIDIIIKTSKNSAHNVKEKHGNVFPDLRVSPNSGEEMGQADDVRLNALFGTEEDSFFNSDTNSAFLVAVAALSGQDHYRMGNDNDTFIYDGTAFSVRKLLEEKANAQTQEEKDLIGLKIAKLQESAYQADETVTEFNPSNEAEDANFNPDFGVGSVSWRYIDQSSNSLNDKSDGNDNVGSNQYPNLTYPMAATSFNTGNINIEENVAYTKDQPRNNNFGSDTQTAHDKTSTDMYRILHKYV